MADDEREGRTISWAQFISGKTSANPGQANDISGDAQGTPAPAPIGENSLSSFLQAPEDRNQQKQLKMAVELAEMIELDLARHPDCPKAGFRVTVYGWPRWRALLTIEPAAGGVQNPQQWRELTQELAERLRKRYDLAWEE
jgi:hypothetical protein